MNSLIYLLFYVNDMLIVTKDIFKISEFVKKEFGAVKKILKISSIATWVKVNYIYP